MFLLKIFFWIIILLNIHCLCHWLFPFWQESTCVPTENHIQENFNLTRFLGRWYETHHKNNHKVFLEGEVIDFTIQDKLVKSVIEDEKQGLNELITHFHLVYSDDQLFIHPQNDFERQINDTTNTPFTVIETDYSNYAVLYSCLQPQISDKCEEESQFLSVIGRSPKLGKTLRSYIADVVSTKLCINLNDIAVSQTNDQRLSEDISLVESSSCRISDIKSQENFSFKKFLGVWFNLAQSRIQESKHLDGAISSYIQTSDATMQATYFGNIKGHCITPLHVKGDIIADNVPEFVIKYELRNVLHSDKIRILYTDYEDSAIVYVCYKENKDGTCAKHSTFVDFMSRYPAMTNQTRQKLNNIIQNFCVQPEEVIDANYSVNCIPEFVARMLEERKIKQVLKNEDENDDSLPVPGVPMEKTKNNQDKHEMETKNLKATLYIKNPKEFSDFEVNAIQIAPKEIAQVDRNQIITTNEPKDLDEIEDKVIFKDNDNTQKKQNIKESDSSDSSSEEKEEPKNYYEIKNDEETITTEKITTENKNQKDESGSSEEDADESNEKIKHKNKKDKEDKSGEDKSSEEDNKNENNEDENKELKQKNKSKLAQITLSKTKNKSNEKEKNSEDKKLKKDESTENNNKEKTRKQAKNIKKIFKKKNTMKPKRPKGDLQSKKLEKESEQKQEKHMDRGLSDSEWFFMVDRQLSGNGDCRHHSLLAQNLQTKTGNVKVFIPRCDSNGLYRSVQCNDNDECWCVNPDGVTIPGTRRHIVDIEKMKSICDYIKKTLI